MRQRRGLTLAEILVSLFLIGIFGLVAVGSLNMALRSWGTMASKVNAAQNARFATTIMANELRQALPAQDGPAVLEPDAGTAVSDELRFHEPHPAFYRPENAGWTPTTPNNYRRVRYLMEGRELVRYSEPQDGQAEVREVMCAASPDGTMQVEFRYQAENLFDITVTATERDYTTIYTTRCFTIGR